MPLQLPVRGADSASVIDVLLTCVFEKRGWKGSGQRDASVIVTPIKGRLLAVERNVDFRLWFLLLLHRLLFSRGFSFSL